MILTATATSLVSTTTTTTSVTAVATTVTSTQHNISINNISSISNNNNSDSIETSLNNSFFGAYITEEYHYLRRNQYITGGSSLGQYALDRSWYSYDGYWCIADGGIVGTTICGKCMKTKIAVVWRGEVRIRQILHIKSGSITT